MLDEGKQAQLDLVAELAANNRPAVIDPATVPWRFSTLRAMSVSAQHYHHAAQDQVDPPLVQRLGAGAGRPKPAAMVIGAGTHAITFDQPHAVYSTGKRAGKAWEEFQEEHKGAAIMNPREHSIASGIANALRRHPQFHLLADGVREETIWWEYLGRKCRSTPDVRGKHHIVDLKTTRCAEPIRFGRDAMFRGYHAQAAFYADATLEAGLGTAQELYLFAIESVEPYAVTVMRIHENTVEQGRRAIRLWAERALACEAANAYPPYVQEVVTWDIGDQDPFALTVNGEELPIDD